MDLISWSSTILKSWSNYNGLVQHPSLLAAYWPWSEQQNDSGSHPAMQMLDISALEAAAINFYRHPAIVEPLTLSTPDDKRHHQLSFGIDRILGDQVGNRRSNSVSTFYIVNWLFIINLYTCGHKLLVFFST